jgi:NitT/TauT family transport system ATP-binding protein
VDGTNCLRCDGVAIRLGGREILSPTSFEVARGEFVCIVGPSGCGKTTLLRAASGLVTTSAGGVWRNGRPMSGPSRDVAFVFQDYGRALLPWRSVAGNVSLALEAAGIAAAERAPRIDEVLGKVGLSRHAQKFPVSSGGMRQRAQIARCLAQRPELMMMDEPSAPRRADATGPGTSSPGSCATTADGAVRHPRPRGSDLPRRPRHRPAGQSRPRRPSLARMIDVRIERPRDQLTTKETPEFCTCGAAVRLHRGEP